MANYLVKECEKGDSDLIIKGLVKYNFSHVPPGKDYSFLDMSRKVVDEYGTIVAGILGKLDSWGCMTVDILWVHEKHRKAGLGTRLLKEVEAASKSYGCNLVHLDTFDFQAKDFYIKNGYEVFGVLDDCPLGHQRYFLKKYL